MISIVKKHGFLIRSVEHDQFDYKFSNGTAMLNHYFIRLAFMDSWIRILPENKLEQVFDIVEKRLNEQSKKMGSFKLSIPFVLIDAIKE
jgi:hypothetical protein